MKMVAVLALAALALAGCSKTEPVIEHKITVKDYCNTVESCKQDRTSEDPAISSRAAQWLTKRELMDNTMAGMTTENAAFNQQLVYWRHVTQFCSEQDAERERCVSIDSPDVPPKVREILLKERAAVGLPAGG